MLAENGDVIASNVKKGILSDGINIARKGLDIEGDLLMNFHVGKFLEKLSLYEQKEISWGFYANNINDSGMINVLYYEDNKINESAELHKLTYKGNLKLRLAIGNHTHPGLFGKQPGGVWDPNSGGGTMPSDPDKINGIGAKYGNLIWSRKGVRFYDRNGPKATPNHPNGLIINYNLTNSVRDRNYIKNILGWKKTFNTPPN